MANIQHNQKSLKLLIVNKVYFNFFILKKKPSLIKQNAWKISLGINKLYPLNK